MVSIVDLFYTFYYQFHLLYISHRMKEDRCTLRKHIFLHFSIAELYFKNIMEVDQIITQKQVFYIKLMLQCQSLCKNVDYLN